MGNFKEELKGIIGNALLSFHGDPSQSGFLVQYGSEKHIISVAKILDAYNDEKELSIEHFLSSSQPIHDPYTSNIILIGEIRLLDPTHNKLGSFEIQREGEQKYLFGRVFFDNLRMIDGDMPQLLEAVVNIVATMGIHKSSEILKRLIESNPLHIANGWEENTYRFKFGRLLYNFALGMTEEVVWHGHVPNGGVIINNVGTFHGLSYFNQTSLGNCLIDVTEFMMIRNIGHIELLKHL